MIATLPIATGIATDLSITKGLAMITNYADPKTMAFMVATFAIWGFCMAMMAF